jgi:hypothetical protein
VSVYRFFVRPSDSDESFAMFLSTFKQTTGCVAATFVFLRLLVDTHIRGLLFGYLMSRFFQSLDFTPRKNTIRQQARLQLFLALLQCAVLHLPRLTTAGRSCPKTRSERLSGALAKHANWPRIANGLCVSPRDLMSLVRNTLLQSEQSGEHNQLIGVRSSPHNFIRLSLPSKLYSRFSRSQLSRQNGSQSTSPPSWCARSSVTNKDNDAVKDFCSVAEQRRRSSRQTAMIQINLFSATCIVSKPGELFSTLLRTPSITEIW